MPQDVPEDTPPLPDSFTIAEAASAAGVTEKTVRRMVKAGSIPAIQEPIPGGFKYRIPRHGIAQIAHEIGDRVLPRGVPSQGRHVVGGLGTPVSGYPGVPVAGSEISELRQERDAWRRQAEEAQQALARSQEALSRQQATIDNLIIRALPEPRAARIEEESASAEPRRGFWSWFWGR